MASKKHKKFSLADNSNSDDTNQSRTLAKVTLKPSLNAAAVIDEYGAAFGKQDIAALTDALNDSIDKVLTGDMKTCEAMLVSQAHALQSIFMNLARRAIKQEYMKNYDIFLKLALKAQSQCRSTLEALAMIKNPPVVFAKQANIAHGHQQINNGTFPHPDLNTHAEKNNSNQNELLEVQHEQRLEPGTANAPGSTHSQLAAVETSNRSKN